MPTDYEHALNKAAIGFVERTQPYAHRLGKDVWVTAMRDSGERLLLNAEPAPNSNHLFVEVGFKVLGVAPASLFDKIQFRGGVRWEATFLKPAYLLETGDI